MLTAPSLHRLACAVHDHLYSYDPPAPPAPYFVDCATVKINTSFSSRCGTNKGIKFGNPVHDLDKTALGSAVIEGIARVRNTDLLSGSDYKVYKVGEKTGWTTDKIFAAEMDWNDPRELHGVARAEAFARLLETLACHGSATLRAAIERHRDEVRGLFDRVDDIEALAEQLRAPQASECVR